MTLPCSECAKSLHIRVDLSSAELSDLYGRLRLEFGPFVMDSRRADELKKALALADKDIEDHDSEVDRLQTQIVFVQGEKKRLETQRAKLRSLLSPVRKLPNETLLHILQYVCRENVLQSSTLGLWTYPPAMAISSVCSRWRELALVSPSLWANLTVEMNTAARARGENLTGFVTFVDTVTRYLARSGDWPLRLALTIRGLCHRPAVVPLMQQAYRWKTFRFRGVQSLTDYKIISPSHFPLLEELDVDLGITSNDLDLFKHCPRLRTHTLYYPAEPTSEVFHQLEHLSSSGQSLVVLAEAVHACPLLKSLKLGPTTDTVLEDGTLGTWHNITSLSLERGSSINLVFSSLNLPSLNTFVIDGTGQGDWQANLFTLFISRASCMITTFTVCGISMSDSDLIAALHLMPSLLYLKIDQFSSSHDAFTPRLIASLTHSQSTCALVPKVHSFHLTTTFDSIIDDAGFIRMVQSRWFKPGSDLCAEMLTMGRACIRSIVLNLTHRKVDPEIYKALQLLDPEGLRVVVSGINGMPIV